MAKRKITKIEFEDYSDQVIAQLRSGAVRVLHESAGELVDQARRNSRVDTGQLKNSWDYFVNKDKLEATIGSPEENAIWEEFGTGEYAVKGNGRKGGWFYVDRKGQGHFTRGKTPNRTLERAYQSKLKTIKTILEGIFK